MREEFPIVPAMITGAFETSLVPVATFAVVPITRPKSLARSLAARVTPGQSLLSSIIVGARPLPPSWRPPRSGRL